MWGIF
jgi:hypothetical protein